MPGANGIGVYRESSLHAALKALYAEAGGNVEAGVDSFVCDAVRSDGTAVEIQTGSFAPLLRKLRSLSEYRRVLVVHPAAIVRHIETRTADGAVLRRRRSPRKGSAWDVFSALVYAPSVALLPNVTVEVALVEDAEIRIDDGRGSWRRKGMSRADRDLVSLVDRVRFASKADWAALLPAALSDDFGTRDLAEAAGIRPALAGKALYVLSRIGVLEEVGKRGNAKLYARATGGKAR